MAPNNSRASCIFSNASSLYSVSIHRLVMWIAPWHIIPPRLPLLEAHHLGLGLALPSPYFSMESLPAAAAAKSLQSCPTPFDPIDGSPPGSPVPGILQARTLEWVAISFSNTWKWNVKVKSLSRVRLFAMPWTAAHQAPLSYHVSKITLWYNSKLTLLILHTR